MVLDVVLMAQTLTAGLDDFQLFTTCYQRMIDTRYSVVLATAVLWADEGGEGGSLTRVLTVRNRNTVASDCI